MLFTYLKCQFEICCSIQYKFALSADGYTWSNMNSLSFVWKYQTVWLNESQYMRICFRLVPCVQSTGMYWHAFVGVILKALLWVQYDVSVFMILLLPCPLWESFVQEGINGGYVASFYLDFELGWQENQPPPDLRLSGMRILVATTSVVVLK